MTKLDPVSVENQHRMHLPAKTILLWLVVLCGLTGSTILAMNHLIFGANALTEVTLWVLRCLVLASFWLFEASRAAKGFGIGLIFLALLLDVLLKLPVLGSVEYGDWFFVSGMDLSGDYSGYFLTLGLLLPLLMLTGWFVLRPRTLAGWITGLLSGLGFGFITYQVAIDPEGSLVNFVLATLARFILPALLSVAADALVRRISRQKLSAKS